MPVTIKRIGLWRTTVANRPGAVAEALEPVAQRKTDVKLIRVRALPGGAGRRTVEIDVGRGKRALMAARAAGFSLGPVTTVILQGDNHPGLAYAVANAVAWAGIRVCDLEGDVVGARYSAILTFDSEADAEKAVTVIRQVTRGGVRPAGPAR